MKTKTIDAVAWLIPGVVALALGVVLTQGSEAAIYVGDSSGNLGIVDPATGSVNLIGNMGFVMTDIAYNIYTDELWAITTSKFYSIDTATAAATSKGTHGVSGANGLAISAAGIVYAMGNGNPRLYTINTSTGAGLSVGDTTNFSPPGPFSSAGDLEFYQGVLYLSSTTNHLVKLGLDGSGNLSAVTDIGAFGVGPVYGLATDPENGKFYGMVVTKVYTINTGTGAATFVSNYTGQGLGAVYGASGQIPEPASMAIWGALGAVGLAGAWWRRRRKAA